MVITDVYGMLLYIEHSFPVRPRLGKPWGYPFLYESAKRVQHATYSCLVTSYILRNFFC